MPVYLATRLATLLNAPNQETPMSTKPMAPRTPKTKARVTAPAESRAADSRPGAVSSLEMVNLFEGALASPTRLLAKAWVRNVAYDKKVWLDVDLLSRSGQALRSETLPLQYLEPAGGAGDFFLGNVAMQAATRSTQRAVARQLRYRLYYEVGGQVFTDGVCHHHHL
jgi:hypothetical protein